MIVKTHKLPATDTEPDRIAVRAENGVKGEFPWPHRVDSEDGQSVSLDGRDAYEWAVLRLLPEAVSVIFVRELPTGNEFEVPNEEEQAERDKWIIRDTSRPREERREAFLRHNRRQQPDT